MSLRYEKAGEENERQILPEEYLAEQKNAIRKRSFWAIGIGILLILAHLVLFAIADVDFSLLFRSIFFILGLFALFGGIWGLYEARRMKLQDLIPTPEAILFAQQAQFSNPYFTYILIGCIVAVSFVQLSVGLEKSVDIAGFVKTDFVSKGELWRILTGAALHGGLLHLYFNSQALYGFGSLIEFLSNRAHLAIVFLLAIIGGGFLSLFLMPDVASIGASGGIMGLIGYLAIYGYRRKQQLPPDFLKSMLINVGFIAAFGVIAYQIVDNFAHIGGFLTGAIYGFIQIPRDLNKNPRKTANLVKMFGFITLGIFIGVSLLSILLFLRIINL